MNDQVVRAAFHKTVLRDAHRCNQSMVIDELGLNNGAVRADIAVLGNKFCGYEIKTSKDNLNRLPNQVRAYSEVFEETYIVVSKKHFIGAKKIIPKWWGIYLIEEHSSSEISFTYFREALPNPNRKAVSVAQLLWKEEAFEVATKRFNCNLRIRNTRCEIYASLSQACETKELSDIVVTYLKQRGAWRQCRSGPFQNDDCYQPSSTHLELPVFLRPLHILQGADLPWKNLLLDNQPKPQLILPISCIANNLPTS